MIASSLRWLEEDHDHGHDHEDEFNHYNMTETSHHEDHNDKPWGEVIAASMVIQLATFSGLLLSAFFILHRRFFQASKLESAALLKRLTLQFIPAFAGGAILSTAVFLIIPESFMKLQEASQESHEEEEEALHAHEDEEDHDHLRYLEEEGHEEPAHGDESYFWKFGAAILAGFLFPILLGAIFPPADASECEECKRQERLRQEHIRQEQREVTLDLNCEQGNCCHQEHMDESDDGFVVDEILTDEPHFSNLVKEAQAVPREDSNSNNEEAETNSVIATDGEKVKHSRNVPLASSILIGDAFHNFTDGVFLGNAFLLCDRTVAYTIVATTIYHELAQEVADYGLLVHHCGLKPVVALTLNFLSSFSLMLGSLLILSIDMSDIATGIVLAISAGVYIYLGASECVPRAHAARKKPLDTFYFFLCFLLGAVPIGLVLLNHEHCEAEGHDGH